MSTHQNSGPVPLSALPPSDDAHAGILPDPLLQSGTYIDASESNGGSLLGDPTGGTDSPKSHLCGPSCDGNTVSGRENCAVMDAPLPNRVVESTNSAVDSRLSSRKRASEHSSTPAAWGALDWLPSGWHVEDRVRTSGATAGAVDKYYRDPVSGRRFRSKNEVLYFLETGKRKKKLKGDCDGSDGKSGRGSRVVKFDHDAVPEGVRWVLTDASAGTWCPFIGDEKVPESNRRCWDAAFESLSKR